MAKKNFKGVPDDYATNPIGGWSVTEDAFKFGAYSEELKNVCGICGLDHTKVVANHTEPKPQSIAQIDEMLKDMFGQGTLTQQQAADLLGISYKPPVDPVLIKGSGYKAGPVSFSDTPTLPEPMAYTHMPKKIKIQTKIEIPGYSDGSSGYKVHGFGHVISEYVDITESQLRKMLMDGFMKITDDIINNMKEKNK